MDEVPLSIFQNGTFRFSLDLTHHHFCFIDRTVMQSNLCCSAVLAYVSLLVAISQSNLTHQWPNTKTLTVYCRYLKYCIWRQQIME